MLFVVMYSILLACFFGVMLTPKVLLLTFAKHVLSVPVAVTDWPWIFAQDMVVAGVWCFALIFTIRRHQSRQVAYTLVAGLFILLIELIDMRSRQLWLRPIDMETTLYAIQNYHELRDGAALFFNQAAGFGMTFRKSSFFVVSTYFGLCAFLVWLVELKRNGVKSKFLFAKKFFAGALVLILVLFGVTMTFMSPRFPYQLQSNPFIRAVVDSMTVPIFRKSTIEDFTNFEGKISSLAQQRQNPTQLLTDIKPFKNVIFVVYESVRWNSTMQTKSLDGISPELKRLATEGLSHKAYVAIPHSSKAYHSLLTGRYSAPGIEILEAAHAKTTTIWHELKARRGMKTFAFSALHLGFENMRGQLKAAGIDEISDAQEISTLGDNQALKSASSFGGGDEQMYVNGIRRLGANGVEPFVAYFFPVAAHYPYECEGSVVGRRAYPDYQACIRYSDQLLKRVTQWLSNSQIGKDTLLVVIGDHGESFGERGLFVHNSSLFNEEVTVPCVLWSSDGRLSKHKWPLEGRQIDLIPTVADLLGAIDLDVPVQGVSLLRRPVNAPMQTMYFSTFYDGLGLAVLKDGHKHILDVATGKMRSFNLAVDPDEKQELEIAPDELRKITASLWMFYRYQKEQLSVK